ncbi:Polynucleotide 5'-hydroxyl-kinase [Apiospora saccharicola]|uniref:Polynucleotide 5'-hydroxyl-kinase GRC3 n=1 Tax=Apiospora saccharicola TaxID=335842 RepID=A0ABR1WGZ7_9PEZI
MATNKRLLSAVARLRQARAAAAAAVAEPDSPEAAAVMPTATTTSEAEGQTTEKSSRRTSKRHPNSPQKQASVPAEENGESSRDDQGDAAGTWTLYEVPPTGVATNPEPITPEKSSLAFRPSNFQPTKANLKKKAGKLYLQLSGGERLVLLGNYGVRVISGEVTLNGALLKGAADKTHWVCAPQCYALPVLRCPDEAAIELAPHPAAENLGKMGRLSPLFRRIWNDEAMAETKGKSKQSKSTFELLFTSADGPKKATLFDLVSPPEWNRKIDELVATSRSKQVSVMVTGPKSSGKSTFGRLLTNNLFTYYSTGSKRKHAHGIAVLDLDPGQPEYCIAGQIGLVHVTEPLLGPSFCRPLPGSGVNILRSHTLASMSPASDTSLYIVAAVDLFNHYRNRLGNCPLVINTAGWVQGIGLDLLISLVDSLRPTDLVYMAPGPVDIVRSLQESMQQGSFTQLPSQTSQNTSRTAAQLRTMQTMSYFHAENKSKPGNTPNIHTTWNLNPLTMVAPWQIRYSGPSRGVMGIMCYGYQTPPSLLADAINGTVLAVVEIESPMAFRYGLSEDAMDLDSSHESQPPTGSPSPTTVATPEGLPFINVATTLDPKYSQTIGLALVRGIDVDNSIIQILTPITEEKIEEVNEKGGQIVLVSGKFDPPSWAYTEDLYYGSRTESTGENGSGDVMEVEDDEELNTPFIEEEQQEEVNLVSTSTPWIEVLRGAEKRGAASKMWRVRRDLGRTGATAD